MDGIILQVRYYLKKDCRAEFYRRFRDNNIGELSIAEEGNLGYEMYYPLDSNDDICIIERWRDEKSQEAHLHTLHYAILNELKQKFVKKVSIRKAFYEVIVPDQNILLQE